MSQTPDPSPPPAPRFGWPMRILLFVLVVHMLFRSTDILYPWEEWLVELDMRRNPRPLPTRARLAKLYEDPGANKAVLADLKECGTSVARYWNCVPTEDTRKRLDSPWAWTKYGIVWTATRLNWCESLLSYDQEWAMFTPTVSERRWLARARLRFQDGSEVTVRPTIEPEDFTCYARCGGAKARLVDNLVVEKSPRACAGYCNLLAHRVPRNDAGFPLYAILLYELHVDVPPPGEDPHAHFEEMARLTRDHRSERAAPTYYVYFPDTKSGAFISYDNDRPRFHSEKVNKLLDETR